MAPKGRKSLSKRLVLDFLGLARFFNFSILERFFLPLVLPVSPILPYAFCFLIWLLWCRSLPVNSLVIQSIKVSDTIILPKFVMNLL